jgi:ABC-type multidrug transport system ATPase subunit
LTQPQALPDLAVRIGRQTHHLSARRAWTCGSGERSAIQLATGSPDPWFTLMFAAVWALRVHDGLTEVWLDGQQVAASRTVPLPGVNATGHRITLRRGSLSLDLDVGTAAPAPPVHDRGNQAGAVRPVSRPGSASTRTRWKPPTERETVIGRSGTGADIEVPGPNVAARHATVRRTAQGSLVLHDHSRHLGTYVDGRRILVATLQPGAHFTVGSHVFEVTSGGALALRRLAPPAALTCRGLTARYRGATGPGLANVAFSLPMGQVMAVIGPSGTGKSTLCRALLGEIAASDGVVRLDGYALAASQARPSHLMSLVPQSGSLHDHLTVRQSLLTTARLRLAHDLTARQRAAYVSDLLRDLHLDQSGIPDKPIGKLSGGQRRRVSIALELLSEPALLILDEPTSGLDEGLDRSTMALLRRFAATRGCAVLVVTHSTANLELADTVLAITAGPDGGTVGYLGPPDDLCPAFGTTNHAEVMDRLREGAVAASRQPTDHLPRDHGPSEPAHDSTASKARRSTAARRGGTVRSTALLTVREVQRLRARPRQLLQPLLLYPALTTVLAGWADAQGMADNGQVGNHGLPTALSVLTICTAFFAMALSFSSVVADREIIEREARWGVPASAAVTAKALVTWTLALLQAALATTFYALWKAPPTDPVLNVPQWAGKWTGLALALPLVALACVSLGLLVSAASRQLERATFTLMGVLAGLVVLTGLLIPLGALSNPGVRALSTASLVAPTRWGVAAIAADIGLNADGRSPDAMWTHDLGHVATACAALALLALLFTLASGALLSVQVRRRQ